MIEWIIGGVIAAYCIYLIIRKIKKVKKGEWCSCGCSNCSCGCDVKKDKGHNENNE